MAVVGGGDAVGKKRNNQIEARTVVVGTVGMAIDCGEARAKGKKTGWRTMQGDHAAKDATGGVGGQCKATGWWRMQREGWTDWVVDDTKRGEGQTPRTQCSGRRHNKRGVRQCKAHSLQ
jgi:hypothetical protein